MNALDEPRPDKMQAPILLEKHPDGVAVLTLNRPDKLNAINQPMIEQWSAHLCDLFNASDVHVVVITGAGRAFCAGGDAEELLHAQTLDSLGKKNLLWEQVHRIAIAIDRSDKPVIAAVNGTARGAGCDMALMCDMRIAASSATFAESYIHMGLIAGDGGAYYLPRLVGVARALELFWTGRVVPSDEAERIGLVNRVVPDAEFRNAVMDVARQIAKQPPDAVRFFKRAVYQSQTQSLVAHLDMISSHMAVLFGTADFRDRVDAFMRRK